LIGLFACLIASLSFRHSLFSSSSSKDTQPPLTSRHIVPASACIATLPSSSIKPKLAFSKTS
jgi:hypothetical protein